MFVFWISRTSTNDCDCHNLIFRFYFKRSIGLKNGEINVGLKTGSFI